MSFCLKPSVSGKGCALAIGVPKMKEVIHVDRKSLSYCVPLIDSGTPYTCTPVDTSTVFSKHKTTCTMSTWARDDTLILDFIPRSFCIYHI